MPEFQSERSRFLDTRMHTANVYVRGGREVEGFAIFRQLLTFSDLPLRHKATAHLILSLSDKNEVFHARKAVEYFGDMLTFRKWGQNYKEGERMLALAEDFLQRALDDAAWKAWDKHVAENPGVATSSKSPVSSSTSGYHLW